MQNYSHYEPVPQWPFHKRVAHNCCPGLSPAGPPVTVPCCRSTTAGGHNRHGAPLPLPGSGAQDGDNPTMLPGIDGDNPGQHPFLLHVAVQSGLQGVKAKFPFSPNSFSTMAEITPPLRVSLWKDRQRCQSTRRSLVFSPNGSFTPTLTYVACYAL